GQAEQTVELQVPAEMRFLLALPEDYEQDQQKKWPLMLFLHGSGERGDNFDLVKVHGPPMQIAAGKKFPMIVASPQCPAGKRWQAVTLLALIDHLAAKYRVDQDRIYVTGLSMGGFGTWALAAYAPERLAAIVPICGGGERYWARDVKHLPIWAFHGAKDTAVPVERSESMIEAITKAGGKPKLTIYPDAGHNSWKATYDNPEVYTWLLSQKRGQAAADPTVP
ncbi:MAG: prolyl oligopeptidase family serine peptidase, partial [Planctomycetaceae bacterium]|nr:prolyl oligopeptidase family serine peptidase [Planctomycetaceae bacterium]